MGRSLQLLAQVGSPQFLKCVSLPSSSSSSSAPSVWTLTSTRKNVKSNVVVSLKDSARTTGRAPLPQGGTGPAMTATTGNTTALAELTTTRERLRQRQRLTPLLWLNLSPRLMLTPSMATMGTAWGTPTGIPTMLKASTAMDLDMDTALVWVTSTDQPVVHYVLSN